VSGFVIESFAAAAPPGSPRWFAWLYSDAGQRAPVAAAFALEHEIAASARPEVDHAVAHARLDWWEGELERLESGRPAHPIGQALLQARVAGARLPFAGLLENARWDLANATFVTRAELEGYCRRWARAICAALAPDADGNADAEADAVTAAAGCEATTSLAIALRELELLDSLAADARQGRLRLPLEEL
jgi:phytoene synthase